MSGSRQKTQHRLSRRADERGEAPSAVPSGAEPVMASAAPESPAATLQLMEEVCQRENSCARGSAFEETRGSRYRWHDHRGCQGVPA